MEGLKWNNLAQDRYKRQIVGNRIMNLQVT
jgi:hypothetical protein